MFTTISVNVRPKRRAVSISPSIMLKPPSRRWHRLGLAGSHFVELNGKPIKSVRTGFRKAVALVQLNGGGTKVVPHTLRHTAATWLMQRGVSPWEAAGYLGMSTEMIERVYGHHSPEHLRKAAEAITGKTESVSVVVSVVGEKNARPKHR